MESYPTLEACCAARQVAWAATAQPRPASILFPEEQIQIAAALPQRQREFAAGRFCARQAMAALGFDPRPVLSGPEGEPLWPAGVRGSLSHTRGWCCAVVAEAGHSAALGVDVESWETWLGPEAVELIANPDEQAWLAQAGADRTFYARLLFSAKESFFKLAYQLFGRRSGFQAVSLLPAARENIFSLRLRETLGLDAAAGQTFSGWHFSHPQGLVTLMLQPA